MQAQSSETLNPNDVIVHLTPPPPPPPPPPPATSPAKLRPSTPPPIPKPKSRFVELNCPPRPNAPKRSHSFPARDPTSDSDSDSDDRPFADKFLAEIDLRRRHPFTFSRRARIETLALLPASALLIATLFLKSLHHKLLLKIKIWRWCVVLISIFSGRLISGWLVWAAVFLIERHFLLQEKVLYFVYGLRKSVRGCVWLGLVLLAWFLVLNPDRYDPSSLVQRFSRGLVAVFVACTIWLLKIIFVKVLASSFHVATFFDRMKESVFHHYVLEALSGDPKEERISPTGAAASNSVLSVKCFDWASGRSSVRKEEGVGGRERKSVRVTKSMAGKVDMERLRRLSRAKASAASVRRMVGVVMKMGLRTVSRTVDELVEAGESEIGDEMEAMAAAQQIFRNVAGPANK